MSRETSPVKVNRSAYCLSIEEIQSLFLEIDSYQPTINAEVFHRLALEYRILFRMLFCCGLRVSEARKLRLDTVDLENGVLKIYQSKGSNDRLVYLPDDLRQLCCEYLKIMTVKYKIKSEWFFPASDPAKVLQVASVGKRFHRAWEQTPYAREGLSSQQCNTTVEMATANGVKCLSLFNLSSGKAAR